MRSSGVKLLGLAHVLLNVPALPRISNAGVRTVLFVMQMLPLPVKPQTWVSREPVREAVTFPLSYGQGTADIYRIPGGKVRAGVLVFFGINPAPRDDHRVVNLGKGLARAGFVAMFAWSPSLMGKRIDAAEPDNLVWAFRYLRELEYVDPDRVGMGGFCVGASMAILAASDPRINAEVNFVSSFGCYYDMADMVKQVASNRSFYCHTVKPWDPNDLTQEVLTNQLIEGLEEERERDLLASIFIGEGVAAEGPSLDGLSTEGKTVCRLLSSLAARAEERRLTLEEADRLVHELPPRIQAELTKVISQRQHRQSKGEASYCPRQGGRSCPLAGVAAAGRRPLKPWRLSLRGVLLLLPCDP